MPRMQRGNVVVRIDDQEVQHYMLLGYNLTDDKGNVIKAALPTDYASLQSLYVRQSARINELEAMVTNLTAEIERLKKAKAKKSL